MSPFVAYHATRRACRESIQVYGLCPALPMHGRPFGVYVFSEHIRHNTHSKGRGARRIRWSSGEGSDVWQVAYIGPLVTDTFIENAVVLLDRVPPLHVTLVTRND
jgi:hypothetical protein